VAAALGEVCGPGDVLARFGGDEFAVLSPGTRAEEAPDLAARLASSLGDVGYQPPGHDVAVPMSLSAGVAVYPQEGLTRMDVVELADARLRRAKSGAGDNDQADRLRALLTHSLEGYSMLDALVTAVDNKDRYTHRHCEDVLAYSLEIAREVGLDERTQDTVAVAALLHDVGKIGIPDAVLRKPGRLTDEEFAAVRQHPQMGAVIVSAVPGLEETLGAVRHHHERWDGGGYPYGLRGAETPLIARLMAVADAYSAMTTDRPYRKGMDPGRALAVLEAGAGTQWDPQFVAAFLRVRRREAPPGLTLIRADSAEADAPLPLAA
jgi:HD-GYP domain-containing protein (c-di-GMP phosphodiesterase class II)